MSRNRHVSPLIKYSLSPDRNRRRVTTISAETPVYSGSMRVKLTSAKPVGGRVLVPLKMTSAILSPRSMRALCSPRTQLTESDKLDFPHPFGPTMAATPSANSKRVRSANDLNPSSSTFFSLNNLHSSCSTLDDLSSSILIQGIPGII